MRHDKGGTRVMLGERGVDPMEVTFAKSSFPDHPTTFLPLETDKQSGSLRRGK